MGKRIEDLAIDETPIQPAATGSRSTRADARDTVAYQFSQQIDDLLATGRYSFAEDTLRGIQETVDRTQFVTEGQRRAVGNIEESAYRQRRGGSGRRYEGFRR